LTGEFAESKADGAHDFCLSVTGWRDLCDWFERELARLAF